jgi:DME family drug/metabolite transporter
MPQHASRGPLLVMLAAAIWGTTGTAQALGPDGISPETVGWVRMAGGALLIGYAASRHATVPYRSLRGWHLYVAIAAMAASQPLFFNGVARTGVAVGTIVTIGSGPILAGLLAWVFRRERPDRRWVVATSAAISGALLLVSGGEAAGVDGVGMAFSLGAGLAWAVYLIAAKALFEIHPPVFVAGVVFAGAAVLLSPLLLAGDVTWIATGSGIVVALWLGTVSTAVSYVLFSRGLGATAVSTAATLTLAEPVTAAVLGMTLLDEPIRCTTILGIALVALGLVVLSIGTRPRPAAV